MTAPRSEETVRRYSWHVARQIENATKCFVDAADFDVLTAAFNDVTAERDRLREAIVRALADLNDECSILAAEGLEAALSPSASGGTRQHSPECLSLDNVLGRHACDCGVE